MVTGVDELLERVKAAQGPDRKLNEAIATTVDGHVYEKRGRDAKPWFYPADAKNAYDRRDFMSLDRYTGSIDAALALVARCLPGWAVTVATYHSEYGTPYADMASRRYIESDDGHEREYAEAPGPTAPLAILIALLTALGATHDR